MGADSKAITLNQLLLAAGIAMLLCLTLMIAVLARSIQSADAYLLRVGYSQDQLALTTQLDAEVNAMLLRRATGAPDNAAATAIDRNIGAYLASIDHEAELTGDGRAQIDEKRTAMRLSALLGTMRTQVATPEGIGQLRELIGVIAQRERHEVAAVKGEMAALRQRTISSAVVVATLAISMAAIAGWMLSRAIVRPIRALAKATAALAEHAGSARVEPHGIAELRALADRFNDMASEIEAEVRIRTAELEEKNQRLAEIDRTRRLFFSKVSHELRTPVTVMRGEADVALRDPRADTTSLREALEHISANGGFLQRRLDDLLGLARSEDGKIILVREPVALGDIVRSAAAIAEPFARSSGVALTVDADEGAAPMQGDMTWLTQSLLAVIDNGVKFTDGMISIGLRLTQGQARIEIGDNGPGVAAADLPRLFDSYFQTEAGRSRGGTGLGLSLARWVVERHGGTIAARNRDGGGLAIMIDLPLATDMAAAA